MLQQIVTDNIQGIYQSYEYIIPPHGIKVLNSVYSFFTCIEANQLFNVRFSSSAGYTQFEQGLYIQFNENLDYLLIENNNDSPLVIKFGIGCGEFKDNRLTVTGTVKTATAQYATFAAETMTFDDTGVLSVPAAQKVILQNTGSEVVYIGGTGTDGLQLQPQGSFEYSLDEPLNVYGTDGQTISVGVFN